MKRTVLVLGSHAASDSQNIDTEICVFYVLSHHMDQVLTLKERVFVKLVKT